MAEEEKDAEDRTEAATPQKLEKARREGDVPLSREAVHAASLGGAALGLAMMGPEAGRAMMQSGATLFAHAHQLKPHDAAIDLALAAAPAILGVGGLAAAGAVAATLLQTQFLVSGKGLAPQFSRLNPIAGFKKMVGKHALEEFGRTLVKLGAVGVALYWQVEDIAALVAALAEGPEALTDVIATRLGSLLSATLVSLCGIAAIDVLWVRIQHARKLRMTREEMKDEHKESEGDPHFRAHRLAQMRRRGRRRQVAEVANATVLVTNPTHYAVALAYERGRDAAPRIIARGVDELAAKMRAAADKHGVPIIPNPPLARALYKLPEDAQIPEEHFRAVAEIIALVWRLKQPRY
ncbi:EscU/YscU/HrcU family type III secretion system export apparatus switch protein [Falsiroseomonas ponticola]|uniref:EscU/YscU/HrcU family type III secretion system export apparatus switch protein n=1 Tax=Falsiroseomonas ponticola TaxID=2786951 RepID=UPI0019328679|nr:flagellar type III secretion system protein FlhB [Roseomonas ponticola]